MPEAQGLTGTAPDRDEDRQSVNAWMAAWGDEVAAVQLDQARARFDPAVVAFGTVAGMVRGLDELYDEQWTRVWPTIRDFRFELGQLEVLVSPDRLLAVAVVPWSSSARQDTSDDAGPRHGRATVVLRRESIDEPWRGAHTHFSLVPNGSPAG
jgi:ketosteroid isomerase-like protein